MKAAPADQRLLLDIADLDRRLARAKDAKENPPQTARVRELVQERSVASRALAEVVGVRDDLRTEITKVESDVQIAEARRERDRNRLEEATDLASIKALESEIEALGRRLDSLETAQLELMEKIDPAEAAVAEREGAVQAIIAEGQRLSAEGKEGVVAATRELTELERDREAVSSRVSADLLAMYDRLQARGTGAALFRRGVCEGCRMALAPSDLAALRSTPDDEVALCPECGGILVRTEESGLAAGDGDAGSSQGVTFS